MARLTIAIDGETKFDEDVEEWMLPQRPDAIRNAIPRQADGWVQKPAPWMKALMIVAFGKAMEQQLSQSPVLQPLITSIETRATGYTLHVDMPSFHTSAIPLGPGSGQG
jgi:hypothetical protein